MNELILVRKRNDQAVTSSLGVADKFKKQHKHVLRDIKNLTAQNQSVPSYQIKLKLPDWVQLKKEMLSESDMRSVKDGRND